MGFLVGVSRSCWVGCGDFYLIVGDSDIFHASYALVWVVVGFFWVVVGIGLSVIVDGSESLWMVCWWK